MRMQEETPLRLGVSFHTLDPAQRLACISILAGSSVRAVALWEPAFDRGEGYIREARCAFAAADVEVQSVHANFGPSLDLSSPDSGVRAVGRQAVSVAADLAIQIGASLVIIHPSAELIEPTERAARMEHAKRSIEAIAARLAHSGCGLAVELLPRTCLGRSAEELMYLLEDADKATVGLCLDTNHLLDGFSALPEVVCALRPRLIALHCSDYDGVDEKHWPPMRGVIDWRAFIAALRQIEFTGPFHV